jgi:hypothetical protein
MIGRAFQYDLFRGTLILIRIFVFLKTYDKSMKKTFWVIFIGTIVPIAFTISGLLASCSKKSEEIAVDSTRHIQVIAAPHFDYPDAKLEIVSPKEGQVLKKASDSVLVVMQVSGATLGVPTGADSTRGIAYSKQGQHIHVIVDDKPYMAYYKNGEPFNVGVLAAGMHTIRAFPSFSWHESIKSPNAFVTRTFSVGAVPHDSLKPANNLNGPLLTYSRPKGTYSGADTAKVLLDFFVSNATLGPGAYKVRLWIDTAAMPDITRWQPYYIEGLASGKHTIRLALLAPDGSVVPGPYNSPSGEIEIK